MASSNTYAKNYSNRRSTVEVESYKLMLFPADNSIAVVKSKQCSPAEHDGFLYVQSGRKKFSGIVLEEGDLAQCSRAADRLTKKNVHPEIESDYERGSDENQPKQSPTTVSTISTLRTVPFGNQLSNAQSITTSTHTSSDDCPGLDATNKVVSFDTSRHQTNDEVIDTSTRKSPSQSILSADPPPELGNVDKSNKRPKQTINQKNKRRKHSHKEKTDLISFDDIGEGEISSDDDRDGRRAQENQSSINETPSFVGRRVVPSSNESVNRSNSSSILQQLLAATSKLESQYLRPLLIAQERSETLTKCLFDNQKKIAKALRKQKINISLAGLDEPSGTADDQPFLTSLEYTSADGATVDLLKRSGVKEHANRYVTSLMDLLYKPEELLALTTSHVPQDERYLLLKEAVKNKFRLSQEELETMWEWLHTVFLAKRRTLNAKKKQQVVVEH